MGADVELFSGSPDSPYLVRQQAWANAEVEWYLASVKAAVAACTGVTWKGESGNSYTLVPSSSAPTTGPDSTAPNYVLLARDAGYKMAGLVTP